MSIRLKSKLDHTLEELKQGKLIILNDNFKERSYLVGLSEIATPESVNFMTRIGKGLICVCLDSTKARQLNLPLMTDQLPKHTDRKFTISIDYETTTTGISAFERADTIKALTKKNMDSTNFKRPGHIFPIICDKYGLLEKMGAEEASIHLAQKARCIPQTYICEILNAHGEISNFEEVQQIAESNKISIITIGDILTEKKEDTMTSFEGLVIEGKQLGRKLNFPTANLTAPFQMKNMKKGVYGVKINFDGKQLFGVMNFGERPTLNHKIKENLCEIHIFNFNDMIYNQMIQVDVCFFIREEKRFNSIDDLVNQIKIDVKNTKERFNLTQA
ncbi:3,4-dihydroxy-2-butanone-4-phosphate synthase [Bacillus sp. Marseille-P3661]|uniref:3,4-dihydroxy-2-butanone-4-phosphate synthase n=1 Tax=Bacillus sp. Marseille-P3661 TaxID=1936234 RepID=UPI000C844647|nr:3,4-dihydroxy-2-butanone-4-phosphate synthase [Bacillus sp. Marseille-P3661]